jgi:hypothetical protein
MDPEVGARRQLVNNYIRRERQGKRGRIPQSLIAEAKAWATNARVNNFLKGGKAAAPIGKVKRTPTTKINSSRRVTPYSRPSEGYLRAIGLNTNAKAKKAIEKIQKVVKIIPGMGPSPEATLLEAALRSSLEHFASPAVRQAHSGSLLETTSFTVGAMEKGIKVAYFDDDLGKDITRITRLPRTVILKSEFSLDNTIKSNAEPDPELRQVWREIVSLAANKSSVNQNPTNMRMWRESTTSHYKGFRGVEPDVLEWIPSSTNYPSGLLNIFELKIGEGKPEQVPAEAYQLVKAKRSIELTFIAKGIQPPTIRLYFLPWFYSTPFGSKPKFTPYKNFPNHGVRTWGVLSRKDKNGYDITRLERASFEALTGMSAEVITETLNLLRTEEASVLRKLLIHIHRHSMAFQQTSRQTWQRVGNTLRRSSQAPRKEQSEFKKMMSSYQRAAPGANIPPGMNNLAFEMLGKQSGRINAKASNVTMRAIKRLASRPESGWTARRTNTGQVIGPANFGFRTNNNYLSNAEEPGIRNNKEMARITAARQRPNLLNFPTRGMLNVLTFSKKNASSIIKNKIKGLKPKIMSQQLPIAALYSQLRAEHVPANIKQALNQLYQAQNANNLNKFISNARPNNLK